MVVVVPAQVMDAERDEINSGGAACICHPSGGQKAWASQRAAQSIQSESCQ